MSSWVFTGHFGQLQRLVQSSLAGLSFVVLVVPQIGTAQEEALEYAEVSVDRYIPNDSLILEKQAQLKGRALATYYLGLSRQNAGDIDGALDAYEVVLDASPDQIGIAQRAAALAGQFNDGARGRKILEKSFSANQDDPSAYLVYSQYLDAYHDNREELTNKALSVLQDAAKKFPDNPQIYQSLITAHLKRREREEALQVLDGALDRPNDDPFYWLRMARIAQVIYRSEEDHEVMMNAIYAKALELGRGNSEVEDTVADYYSESGQYEKARDLYRSILAERPEELNVRQKLARIYALLGEQEMELQTLVELEQINPHRPETQRFLAQRFIEKGDLNQAIDHFTKALRIEPGQPRDYDQLTEMLLMEQRYQEAIETVERAMFHYPDVLGFRELLGRAMTGAEMYEDAYQVFKEAELQITESGGDMVDELLDFGFYFSYGAAAERSEHFEEAAEMFRKSIDLVPNEAPQYAAAPYNYLGYMWLEQDMHIEEAGELIIRANELRPDSGAYVDSLGWYYFKKGDYEKALVELLRAEDLLRKDAVEEGIEEDAVVIDHVGQAYYMLGHQDKAIEYLERAVALDPDTPEYASRLEEYREKAPEGEKVPLDFLKPQEGDAEEDPKIPVGEEASGDAAA